MSQAWSENLTAPSHAKAAKAVKGTRNAIAPFVLGAQSEALIAARCGL